MQFVILGQVGSDAGYWVWDGKHFRHVGGWGVDQLAEVGSALKIMREAARLKTPEVGAMAAKSVTELVQKQLGGHLKEGAAHGTTVVIVT